MDCFSSAFYPSVSTKYFWYLPWPNREKKHMLKEQQICLLLQSFWGDEPQSWLTWLRFRLDSEQGPLFGTGMPGVETVSCMFSALGLILGFIMKQRGQEGGDISVIAHYIALLFSQKRKKKFFGEFKFFMLFHSEQMNLFPKIIRKLFQHVSYVTLS